MTRNFRVYERPNLPKWYHINFFGRSPAWFLAVCAAIIIACGAVGYYSPPRVACVEVDRG